MQSKPSRWRADPYEVAAGRRLAEGLGVSPVVGSILARRGFLEVDEARRFLAAEETHDPAALPGVPAACDLILDHVRRGSVIAVFGDYDVDGVCSTAMLLRTLRSLGADPVWELPSRFDEGYGLSAGAVERLAGRAVELLVTVDCGITAVEQVAAAPAAGLDVIITDHHRPGEALPDCTVVHPALGDYGCPELCASGVVLKLSEALYAAAGRDPAEAAEDADLAALATVCDLVPLRGENRRILFPAEAAAAAQAHEAAIVVAGEGWHPGVVGLVASRLVERWRRPCVVIALDGESGRGSGRSISPYDLHAGLAACAGHLTRFGGHRMAAGVELVADAVEPFRRALAAHAGAALSPADLIPVERVDAVVPGGLLGLGLAEELECLRPFGMGNPQPTLLVPAARFQHVTGMGEERQHARFTLVTAGGARSRVVAFGSPPKALAPAAEQNHDIALRIERNRWNGMVEPRVILRAPCPTKPGELRGRGGGAWARPRGGAGGGGGARRRGGGAPAAARASPASPETSSRAARPCSS